VAMDILYFDGHPWSFLCDESNSRCVVRVSIEKVFVLQPSLKKKINQDLKGLLN